MKFYWLIILFFLSSAVFADEDYLSYALEAKAHAKKQIALYKNEIEKIQIDSQSKVVSQQYELQTPKKTGSSILIFVSFSMPKQSLEAYLRDANKIQASVVIQGLVGNSFQKTAQRVAELLHGSRGGVELNPIWFKRFGIDKVPAIVVVPDVSACFSKNTCNKKTDFDVISGDVSLSYALRLLNEENDLTGSITKAALRKLEERADV